MSFNTDIADAFDELRLDLSASLVHSGATYSVVRAFQSGELSAMMAAGYEVSSRDLLVMVKASDLSTTPAIRDAVTLDGDAYRIMEVMESNPVFTTLRLQPA